MELISHPKGKKEKENEKEVEIVCCEGGWNVVVDVVVVEDEAGECLVVD